jgi:DNA-binding NarL/FixJ family response regulator
VTALVFMHAPLDFSVFRAPALYDTLPAQDWNIFLRSVAETPAQQEYLRQSISQDDWLRAVREFRQSSIEDALPNLRQPTLVLHAKDNPRLAVEESMNAARLAHGQFALIEGSRIMGDALTGIRAIERFIASITPGQTTAPDVPQGWQPVAADPRDAVPVPLSSREIEVLRLLASGLSSREIAESLTLSVRTVERHIGNIYFKTNTHGRVQATAYAIAHRLV